MRPVPKVFGPVYGLANFSLFWVCWRVGDLGICFVGRWPYAAFALWAVGLMEHLLCGPLAICGICLLGCWPSAACACWPFVGYIITCVGHVLVRGFVRLLGVCRCQLFGMG